MKISFYSSERTWNSMQINKAHENDPFLYKLCDQSWEHK